MILRQPWMWLIGSALALSFLSTDLISCSSGGGDSSQPPTAPPTGSVTVSGTVSGTVIKMIRADNGALISQADTAPLPGPPPFPFTLSNIPIGVPIKAFFFSAGQTFPLYAGNPLSNVFIVQAAVPIDLGFVTMAGGIATPTNQPSNVTMGPADPSIPAGIEPPPPTLMVTQPAPATGSVIVDFSVQNFSIGGQGQQHLHIRVDGGSTRHFFNGSTNKVLDGNGQLINDAQWQSPASFRLNGLSVGQHQLTVRLATAADNEFTNAEANPSDVIVTINNSPSPPPTLNITSPSPGASLPTGPVDVSFTVQDFTIGGQGTSHLHIYVDGGAANHFFNGGTNQVLDGNGQPVGNIIWQSSTAFQITGLQSGLHQIRLVLADVGDQDLQNAEANPPTLNITIQAAAVPTVTVTSGTSFLSSPVTIVFSVTNFTIGLPGTPHMRLSIDGGPQNDFYNGAAIDSDTGILLNGVHTHFVHWNSPTSFILFGLAAGSHQVRLALVDGSNTELSNPESKTTHNFDVLQPPSGDLQLQSVLGGLNFPVGLAQAPDGRIFFNERLTGNVRIINSGWILDPTPFCALSVQVSGEQGLLGLALDPAFASSNEVLYVYYTAPGSVNRVSRLSRSGGVCTQIVILDNLPTSGNHNGGIIAFGPDGMLYVVIGDAETPANAQNIDSLAGKVLRVTSNGSPAPGNPYSSSANAEKVYTYGHRNSFGLTFHPSTGQLWESENGPSDNDEVNRIVAGQNYGWPTVGGIAGNPNFMDPIVAFNPVIAPTGIVGIPSDSPIYPPAHRNNLLMAAWNDGTIRLVIPNGTNQDLPGTSSIAYPGGLGGLLSLMLGSDGYVYASNANGIFRVVPH